MSATLSFFCAAGSSPVEIQIVNATRHARAIVTVCRQSRQRLLLGKPDGVHRTSRPDVAKLLPSQSPLRT